MDYISLLQPQLLKVKYKKTIIDIDHGWAIVFSQHIVVMTSSSWERLAISMFC